jgi:hypothetical protein
VTEKNSVVWETQQLLKPEPTGDYFGPDLLHPTHQLHHITWVTNQETASRLLTQFTEIQQVNLRLFTPHGTTIDAPVLQISRGGFDPNIFLSGQSFSTLKLIVALTPDQILTLAPDGNLEPFYS